MSGLKTSEKDADGDDDFASANSDNPEEDDELYQFLDAVSLFSHSSFDSDVSEDEGRDTLGELKRFAPPPAMDQPMSVMFFMDLSKSTKKRDITGREGLRRIDAVIEVLKRFITQQMAAGAVMDVYSLVTFSTSTYQVRFHRQRGPEAVSKLTCDTFRADGEVKYSKIIQAMEALAVRGQACRVIFLSDGCTGSLENHMLAAFQQAIMDNPHMILHCIGFGDADFSILQQLAQIGRGSFSRASMDIENLVNTFTSLSKTVTQTRNTAHSQERVARTVVFDSAQRFSYCERGVAFRNHGAREGERRTYNVHALMGLKRTSNTACVLRLHKNPFMQGGMRLVYRCQDEDIPAEMVAKFSRFEEDDNRWDFIAMFVKNTAQTRELTQQFHNAYWWARTRSALCNVRQRPTLPVMPPPSEPLQRERGRSPTRRHVESTEPRSDGMETLKAANLLLSDDGSKAKRLLFVGEYTHLFTVAAAKFVKLRLQSPNLKLEWYSTELCWPRLDSMRAEIQQSLDYLRPLGVTAHDNVDATALDLQLRSLAGAIWVMPFPHGQQACSSSREIILAMKSLITGFVKSVCQYLDPPESDGVGGKVSVILLAHQHLAWKLPVELETSRGIFLREVFWMDLVPLLTYGYRPRFGDSRDAGRTARYHKGDEVVIVQWRRKLGQEDRPAGMTDSRLLMVLCRRLQK
eukprot:symbB.v1.2.015849.t1/scaffold1163.1/size134625/9